MIVVNVVVVVKLCGEERKKGLPKLETQAGIQSKGFNFCKSVIKLASRLRKTVFEMTIWV